MSKKQTLLILGVAVCLLAVQPAFAGIYSSASDVAHAIDPAIHKDDARIVGWATGWTEYYRSDGGTGYANPEAALGASVGTFGVVSLGDLTADQIAAGYQPVISRAISP